MRVYVNGRKLILAIAAIVSLTYISTCLFLFFRQRYLIFRPTATISMLPSDPDLNMPYENVSIPLAGDRGQIHGWWIPAPSPAEKISSLPNEPMKILKSHKAILYLSGTGGNKSSRGYLRRIEGLRQLGFGVLAIDYRGYGQSQGEFPSEDRVYADSRAAWDYLTQVRGFSPQQIVIYGESLGGAIALDLAVRHPEAGGLIMQSTFTSMSETVKRMGYFGIFPIDLLLTQRFDSISKVRRLSVPVLFLHGMKDTVVPFDMSQRLYKAASAPKQILLIPKAGHFGIYGRGRYSYLRAIEKFVNTIDSPRDSLIYLARNNSSIQIATSSISAKSGSKSVVLASRSGVDSPSLDRPQRTAKLQSEQRPADSATWGKSAPTS
jgi:uncharacterized protein